MPHFHARACALRKSLPARHCVPHLGGSRGTACSARPVLGPQPEPRSGRRSGRFLPLRLAWLLARDGLPRRLNSINTHALSSPCTKAHAAMSLYIGLRVLLHGCVLKNAPHPPLRRRFPLRFLEAFVLSGASATEALLLESQQTTTSRFHNGGGNKGPLSPRGQGVPRG